ncbi:MAG TPA: hypothetical protein VHX65_10680 [Pirellulales bacterium]|jgi:WD40 repeat protein|nr:hypothetical protein [Pirellulales bacterium]
MIVSKKLCAAALCLSAISALKAHAASGLNGSQVMPKSDHVQLYKNLGDTDSVDVIYQIEWPAMASAANGLWVQLKDSGAYATAKKPIKGWVRSDQLVKLESAPNEYANHLNDPDAGVYYWLNGIYWESQGSPDVAITNFEQAAAGNASINDVEMRLGSLYAASYYQYGTAKTLSQYGENKNWESHFLKAEKAGTPCPQLYLDWGVALTYKAQWADAQRQLDRPSTSNAGLPDPETCYRDACEKLNKAASLAPGWWPVPLARAELVLDCCTLTETGVRKYDPRTADRSRRLVADLIAPPSANRISYERIPAPTATNIKIAAENGGGTGNKSHIDATNQNDSENGNDAGESNRSGNEIHNLVVWDRRSGHKIATFQTNTKRINSVAIHVSHDQKTIQILSGSEDGKARLWECSKDDIGKEIPKPNKVFGVGPAPTVDTSAAYAVAFSADGSQVAVGTENGTVRIWSALEPFGILKQFAAHERQRVSAIDFSGDGKVLLTGSWDGSAKLWDLAPTVPNCVRTFRGHSLPITSVAMLDAPILASARHGKPADGAGRANPTSQTASNTSPADAQDSSKNEDPSVPSAGPSRYILTGSYDYSARLWNGDDGTRVQELDGHCGPVSSLAFAGGTAFLTGSFDETARLWRPLEKDGKTIFGITLLAHPGAVTSLAAPQTGAGDQSSAGQPSTDNSTANSVQDNSSNATAAPRSSQSAPVVRPTPRAAPTKPGSQDDNPFKAPLTGHALADTTQPNGAKTGGARQPEKSNRPNLPGADGPAMVVLTGCADGRAEVWNASKGAKLEAFGPAAGPVTSVAISADGAYVVTANELPDGSSSSGGIAMVLAAAEKDCARAISLNPKSADAFRDRADLLRLQQRLPEAQQSAMNACLLNDFRDSPSLRLLAEIEAAGQHFDDASQHATQAALIEADTSMRDAYLQFRDECAAVSPTGGVSPLAEEIAQSGPPAPNQVTEDNESHHQDQNDTAHHAPEPASGNAQVAASATASLGMPISIFALRPQSQTPAPPSPLTRRFLGR